MQGVVLHRGKKGITVFLLVLLLLISCLPVSSKAKDVEEKQKASMTEALTLTAESAVLLEPYTGTVLYEKEKDKVLKPASVTKIMTLLLIMEAMQNKQFTYDDTVIEGNFLYGMVTNSVSVGGFKRLTGKNVELNDGELEVTLIRQPTNLSELNQIISALLDRDLNTEFIYWFKTARLQIESEEEVAWTLDGEFGGNHKEVLIEDYRETLQIIVP